LTIKRSLLISLIFLSTCINLHAQGIHVPASGRTVGEALTYIMEQSDLAISFNKKELDRYRVSVDSTFTDGECAVRYFLQGIPYKISVIDKVLVISPLSGNYNISGQVKDRKSKETLPFTSIICEGRRYISDMNGNFVISATHEEAKIQFSYLGYYSLDTAINSNQGQIIYLTEKNILLKEILIKEFETGNALKPGEKSGVIRINHSIAKYLPGNGDNSVFNLLRLMPGVRAAGEPSGFSVWGSKAGESAVIFDGSRLFSMNGYNEQISSVNPFMVKEIRVLKGGYGPEFGNQTGAVAQITGRGGNRERAELKTNINNLTANIYGSVPISGKSALSASYRQTYYGLYDNELLNPYGKRVSSAVNSNGHSSQGNNKREVYITPDYSFRDANIRYSGESGRSLSATISIYGASDRFSYSLADNESELDANENNTQFAGSALFDLKHKSGALTRFSTNFSSLDKEGDKIVRIPGGSYFSLEDNNSVAEGEIKISHSMRTFIGGSLEAAAEISGIRTSTNGLLQEQIKEALYINKQISLRRFSMTLGLRGDLYKEKLFFQPRVSAILDIGNNISLSGSWGIYNQFLGKVPVIYEEVAPTLIWALLGNKGYPILKAYHTIIGASWNTKHFSVTIDGFNRKNGGIAQIIYSNNNSSIKTGNAEISGVDLFLKWEKGGNQIFLSTTAASATETYSDSREYSYNPLEAKAGGVLDLNPFRISGAYVYGKGYLNAFGTGRYSSFGADEYNRMDLSVTYAFNIGKTDIRTGLSILNVLNTDNKKTLEILPLSQRGSAGGGTSTLNLYAESIPFTPTLYIEMHF